MQPEPTYRRLSLRAWLTAALGITLVVTAAAGLVSTVVFSWPGTSDVSGNGPAGSVATGPDSGRSAGATSAPATVPPATALPTNGATPPPAVPPPATTPKLTGNAAFEAKVLDLVNVERATAKCKPLTADSRLAKAARDHSADMAARDYFSHDTKEGVHFDARITAAGYRWSAAAENIASGQKDPASVMQSWMNSAGHRANILNCGYRNLGVGLAYNAAKTPYWTQDFGTPA